MVSFVTDYGVKTLDNVANITPFANMFKAIMAEELVDTSMSEKEEMKAYPLTLMCD